jgi:hypothetical protein
VKGTAGPTSARCWLPDNRISVLISGVQRRVCPCCVSYHACGTRSTRRAFAHGLQSILCMLHGGVVKNVVLKMASGCCIRVLHVVLVQPLRWSRSRSGVRRVICSDAIGV